MMDFAKWSLVLSGGLLMAGIAYGVQVSQVLSEAI